MATTAAVLQATLLLFSWGVLACCGQQPQQQPAATAVLQALDLLSGPPIPRNNTPKPTTAAAAEPVAAAPAARGATAGNKSAVLPVYKPGAAKPGPNSVLPAHNRTRAAALPASQVSGQVSNEKGERQKDDKKDDGPVQITLLHFNDWHVRVEATKGSWCGLCMPYDVSKGGMRWGCALRASRCTKPCAQHQHTAGSSAHTLTLLRTYT